MAQVTLCDRCGTTTPLAISDGAEVHPGNPMRVNLPVMRKDEDDNDVRCAEKFELCAPCLRGIERWFIRAVKQQ